MIIEKRTLPALDGAINRTSSRRQVKKLFPRFNRNEAFCKMRKILLRQFMTSLVWQRNLRTQFYCSNRTSRAFLVFQITRSSISCGERRVALDGVSTMVPIYIAERLFDVIRDQNAKAIWNKNEANLFLLSFNKSNHTTHNLSMSCDLLSVFYSIVIL